jgi:hypothetical protein
LAGLLVVAGAIWSDALQKVGWVLLGLGLLAAGVLLLLWVLAAPPKRRVRAAAAAGLATLAVPATVGVSHLPDGIGDTDPVECLDQWVWPWADGSNCGPDDGGGGGGVDSEVNFESTFNISPTVNLDRVAFSLGGVRLGGLRVQLGNGTPGGLRHIERFYADQSFRFGGTDLTETARQRLVFLRRRLARHRKAIRRIEIHGFADYVGSSADNRRLSRERASAVERVLVSGLGLPGERIHVVPHGESGTMADARSDRWRAYDRRVEVKIVRKRKSRG